MKKIINVFISQPMTGKSEAEILATRQKAIDEIHQLASEKDIQVRIIDSYIDDATRKHFEERLTDDINWDIYWLSQSLERLAMADMIWLCDGWEHSKGCTIELKCAIQYGLDVGNSEWGLSLDNGK